MLTSRLLNKRDSGLRLTRVDAARPGLASHATHSATRPASGALA